MPCSCCQKCTCLTFPEEEYNGLPPAEGPFVASPCGYTAECHVPCEITQPPGQPFFNCIWFNEFKPCLCNDNQESIFYGPCIDLAPNEVDQAQWNCTCVATYSSASTYSFRPCYSPVDGECFHTMLHGRGHSKYYIYQFDAANCEWKKVRQSDYQNEGICTPDVFYIQQGTEVVGHLCECPDPPAWPVAPECPNTLEADESCCLLNEFP